MDLIEGIVGIVDMEMIVEDMAVDMTVEDTIDIVVEGKIVGDFGLHKHILTNFVKVGFGFSKEAKPTMAYEYSLNFDTENSGVFFEQTIEMYLQNVVSNLFLVPNNA